MTDPIKSTSALQFADLESKLAECELGLPEKVLDKFCDRIFDSIRIFLEIDEPKAVEKQIKLINRFAKKKFHNGTLFKVIENASPSVLTLMEELSPLPVIPKGEDVIEMEKFRRNIRERLVIGFVEKSDRWENRLIGPKTKGRPPKSRVDVLVSLIAGAYVLATSKNFRRRWDIDEDLPFHQILQCIFEFLNIEQETSVDEAIKRQKKLQS